MFRKSPNRVRTASGTNKAVVVVARVVVFIFKYNFNLKRTKYHCL